MAAGSFAQNKDFKFKFYGQIRTDFYYNSRANEETVDGLFYMYPKDKVRDPEVDNYDRRHLLPALKPLLEKGEKMELCRDVRNVDRTVWIVKGESETSDPCDKGYSSAYQSAASWNPGRGLYNRTGGWACRCNPV